MTGIGREGDCGGVVTEWGGCCARDVAMHFGEAAVHVATTLPLGSAFEKRKLSIQFFKVHIERVISVCTAKRKANNLVSWHGSMQKCVSKKAKKISRGWEVW